MTGYNRALRKFVSPEFITGDGAREFAGRYSLNFNLKKVLFVTDPNIEKCSWLSHVIDSITDNGVEYEVFSSVTENPSVDEVMEGADVFSTTGCDGIIAAGGGSVLDCAKGIGIVAENGGHISGYIGLDLIKNPMPPLICVPSTAGSSADVSQYAVISDRSRRTKRLIVSKSLVPDVSLLDPVPLSTLPREVAVNSAMDALIHAIEGYCSNGSSPVTDTFGLNSVEMIIRNMSPGYWKDPERSFGIMIASLYAGLCFSNAGLGLIHSMSHALGGLTGMNHGYSSFLVAREVLEFNMDAHLVKYRTIALKFGIDCKEKRYENSELPGLINEKIMDIFGYEERPGLADVGILEDDVPELVQRTMEDPCIATNPRLPVAEDIKKMYLDLL
ncbi:MAG: iron-containing alcohol dehydrogenase [Methanomicrobiaceae archaeon]|nr:iron-containing alcohol dehydrogenase [Methanomicrobiaceae archaeon]